MTSYNDIQLELFQIIGKLFYSIAIADKNIRDPESTSIKNIVLSEWKSNVLSQNLQITNQESIIYDSFNALYKTKNLDAKTCFNHFIKFKHQNEHLFTKTLKEKILTSCGKIASSYAGKNKSELILLAKLSIEFNKPSH